MQGGRTLGRNSSFAERVSRVLDDEDGNDRSDRGRVIGQFLWIDHQNLSPSFFRVEGQRRIFPFATNDHHGAVVFGFLIHAGDLVDPDRPPR